MSEHLLCRKPDCPGFACKCVDTQIAELQAEVARLKAEVLRVVRGDFGQICSYCGWESDRKGAAWEELQEHINQCPVHPLTAMKAELDRERGLRLQLEHEKACDGRMPIEEHFITRDM